MSDEEHQKQIYLRENILDKGYDGEDFASFLTSKKGEEGVNLKNWSLDELKSAVQEFINIQSQKFNQINIIQNNYNIYPNVINNMILISLCFTFFLVLVYSFHKWLSKIFASII